MGLISAMLYETKMELKSSIRYRFGFVSDVLVFAALMSFLMLTNSGKSLSDRYNYADFRGLLLYGYIAWMLSTAAISTAANEIKNELQRGTFYLKMNSKYPIIILYIGKLIAATVVQLAVAVVIGVLAALIWKVGLSINLTIILALLINMLGMFGVGLIIAGIALLYKRTGAITLVVQMGLLFITDTIPTNDVLAKISRIFPLTSCNEVIRKSLCGVFDTQSFLIMVLSTVASLAVGIITFNLCLRKAKRTGNLLMY